MTRAEDFLMEVLWKASKGNDLREKCRIEMILGIWGNILWWWNVWVLFWGYSQMTSIMLGVISEQHSFVVWIWSRIYCQFEDFWCIVGTAQTSWGWELRFRYLYPPISKLHLLSYKIFQHSQTVPQTVFNHSTILWQPHETQFIDFLDIHITHLPTKFSIPQTLISNFSTIHSSECFLLIYETVK